MSTAPAQTALPQSHDVAKDLLALLATIDELADDVDSLVDVAECIERSVCREVAVDLTPHVRGALRRSAANIRHMSRRARALAKPGN